MLNAKFKNKVRKIFLYKSLKSKVYYPKIATFQISKLFQTNAFFKMLKRNNFDGYIIFSFIKFTVYLFIVKYNQDIIPSFNKFLLSIFHF